VRRDPFDTVWMNERDALLWLAGGSGGHWHMDDACSSLDRDQFSTGVEYWFVEYREIDQCKVCAHLDDPALPVLPFE
jgi:hypothetical protein